MSERDTDIDDGQSYAETSDSEFLAEEVLCL